MTFYINNSKFVEFRQDGVLVGCVDAEGVPVYCDNCDTKWECPLWEDSDEANR